MFVLLLITYPFSLLIDTITLSLMIYILIEIWIDDARCNSLSLPEQYNFYKIDCLFSYKIFLIKNCFFFVLIHFLSVWYFTILRNCVGVYGIHFCSNIWFSLLRTTTVVKQVNNKILYNSNTTYCWSLVKLRERFIQSIKNICIENLLVVVVCLDLSPFRLLC